MGWYYPLGTEGKKRMPKGPQGHEQPVDVIGCAVMVAQIVTGEFDETPAPSNKVKSRQTGCATRAEKLGKEERSAIAKKATAGRWR